MNGWKTTFLWDAMFSAAMLVSGRVYIYIYVNYIYTVAKLNTYKKRKGKNVDINSAAFGALDLRIGISLFPISRAHRDGGV